MSISKGLLPEFDHEMALTRKTLERAPKERFDWKPHEKSFSLGGLTTHLANVPSWGLYTVAQDSFDVAPVGEEPYREIMVESVEDALERFDKNVIETRAALVDMTDEDWFKPWNLLSGGETTFSMPKIAVFRGFVMNHMIHHRAQLTVYLRLNDVPVPALYGPTADEMS